MKRLARLARLTPALLATLALLPGCRPARALAVGQPAPDFALNDLDGRAHKLADYRGKVVVLEWINPECPFSRRTAEEKIMMETAAKHPDAVWLAVNSAAKNREDYRDPAAHKAYDQQHGITYPVLYDTAGTVGHAYEARTTPHMFVIDEKGNLIYQGAIDDDPSGRKAKAERLNYVDAALTAHGAGKAAEPSSTKPWGCSVKY